MTTPPLPSALTSEEWREGEFESFYGNAMTSAHRDHKGRWFFHSDGPDGRESIVILNQADDNGRASHALAALALHGQRFGFTREDVWALRTVCISGMHESAEERAIRAVFTSLAARIEALLPPETP